MLIFQYNYFLNNILLKKILIKDLCLFFSREMSNNVTGFVLLDLNVLESK